MIYIKNSIISESETALDGTWESINRENHNFSQRVDQSKQVTLERLKNLSQMNGNDGKLVDISGARKGRISKTKLMILNSKKKNIKDLYNV